MIRRFFRDLFGARHGESIEPARSVRVAAPLSPVNVADAPLPPPSSAPLPGTPPFPRGRRLSDEEEDAYWAWLEREEAADPPPEPLDGRLNFERAEDRRRHQEYMRAVNEHTLRSLRRSRDATGWQALPYHGACERCAALEGKVFPLDDTAHLPPLHEECRCVIVGFDPTTADLDVTSDPR